VRGIGRVKVVERTKPGYVTVYDAKDVKRFLPESRVTPVPKRGKKKAKLVPVDKPSPVQNEQLELFKALSPEKKAQAKARAKKAGRRYPNAYDNMISGGAKFEKSSQNASVKTSRLVMRLRNKSNVYHSDRGNNIVNGEELAAKVEDAARRGFALKGQAKQNRPTNRKARTWLRDVEDPSFVENQTVRANAIRRRESAERSRKQLAGVPRERDLIRAEYKVISGDARTASIMTARPAPSSRKAQPRQPWQIKKEDRFLRNYGNRISPKAEEGYKYLKRGRNRRIADAGVSAGFAGLSGGVGLHALKRGSKGWAAVGAAGAALSGASAARSANDAARWDSKMGKIKAKAKERAAAGQYGNGRLVTKSDNKRNEKAMVGGGLAALAAGLSSPRAVSAVERSYASRYAQERDAAQNALRPDGRPDQKKRGEASRQYGEKMKKLKARTGFKTRAGLLTAGFATATPLVWHGSREYVQKKADKHDVDAFMAGALGTAGAYQGIGYATHPWQYKQERNFSPAAKDRIRQHQAETFGTDRRGRPMVPPKGDPRWKKFGRTYPKTDARMKVGPVSVPAHKYKRAMSRLQAGKTQVAITGGLAAVGGLAAAKANRKFHPVEERKVKKSFGLARGALRPRMPRPVGIRAPRIRKPAIRRSYIARSSSGKQFTVRGSLR